MFFISNESPESRPQLNCSGSCYVLNYGGILSIIPNNMEGER
jgi:hypothetical protein